MNAPPTAPTTPYSNNDTAQSGQTNPTDITDTTPAFSAIYNDPDPGDTANKYRVEVNTQSDFTGTVMWDSGASGTTMADTIAGNRSPDIIYAGSPLHDATIYYWRITFWDDSGAQGAVSAIQQFTTTTLVNAPPTEPTTPYCNNDTAQSGQTNPTDITDLTPAFSAIYNDPDPGDIANKYRVEVNTKSNFTGTVMWDVGASGNTMADTIAGNRSPDIIYAGAPLQDATTYYWRITFWDDNGAEGAVSATQQFTTTTTTTVVDVWVTQGSDDAEEYKSDGSMYLGSSDLELAYEDGINAQWIGMRFQNITVPRGATITNAYVQFTADVANSGATDLTVYGQDIGTAPTFTSAVNNISGRDRTSATVNWVPPAWTGGDQGVDQRTPNISSIIEEIVGRGDWASGNDLVIIIDGTGERQAESYEGATIDHADPSLAAYIHIEYSMRPAATTNYRSIGTNNGILYNTGTASIDIGTTTVTFGGGASLPVPAAVGAVGQGDKLII
ncbi:MAG: hypothetical protein GTO14_11550, partial [Anaerolineales bacterium]|nr:hypothetical protein [Anaerolineales bacterium]